MQTLSEVRVQDPILTNFAHGYRHQERIGNILFPPVTVYVSGGKVLKFGKESFRHYNLLRAPGAATKMIDIGYSDQAYALTQTSAASKLPREHVRDAEVMPGIDLQRLRINAIMNSLSLNLEVEQAGIAQNENNYDSNHKDTLGNGEHFDDPDVNVPLVIDSYKEAIRASIGMDPNVMVFGPVAFNAVKNAPSVTERFKYTTANVLTEDMLAQLFGVQKCVVGRTTYVQADDADSVSTDAWGNNIVLAYVPPEIISANASYAPSNMITFETPSYGYTYVMDGNPVMEEPYYNKDYKSWIFDGTYERVPVLTGMDAGFLIKNVADV